MPVVQPDKKKSSYQIELERRANDLLKVFNPFKERYVIEWDRRSGTKLFPIEAESEAVLVRYIAEKYLKEMFQKIKNDRAKAAILKENQRRIKVGMAAMDKTMKTNEQMIFEEKFYNLSDEESKKIISMLYVGVESEYGVDTVSQVETKRKTVSSLDDVIKNVQDEKDMSSEKQEITPENVSSEAPEAKNPLKCSFKECNFIAKSEFGLLAHKRKHEKKSK